MSPKHLTQIWTVVGGLLFYYTLSAWVVSQGGPLFSFQIFYADVPRVESLFALVICSVLLTVLCCTGSIYAGIIGRTDWAGRVPVVWLEELDTRTSLGRWYQFLSLMALVLLPLAGLIHFLMRLSGATVIDRDGLAASFRPFCLLDCPPTAPGTYRIGDGLTQQNITLPETSRLTVDWLPPGEQWVLLGLMLLALVSAVFFLGRVLKYTLR